MRLELVNQACDAMLSLSQSRKSFLGSFLFEVEG
jgi:hypothetical protein